MDSFNEPPEISDVSSIPRSSSTCGLTGRIGSVHNLLESFSQSGNKNAGHDQGGNQMEKVTKAFASGEQNMNEYVQKKIILDCLTEVSTNAKNVLSSSTAKKLRQLLSIHKVKKYMHLPSMLSSAQEKLTTLGITDLPEVEISYEEKLVIKRNVEILLREKIHSFIHRYETLGGNIKEILKSNESTMHNKLVPVSELQVLSWKDKVEELSSEYKTDLLKSKDLIDKWNKLKYEDTSELYLKKANNLLLQTRIAEIQARITKLSCTIRMFKETPRTIDAFKALNAVIDEKLFTLRKEMEEKKKLKKLYDALKGTEYDDVLKRYLQISSAIKKKQHILHML